MGQAFIANSVPQVVLNGIKDSSTQTLVANTISTPIHLPLFYIQAPDGPINDAITLGSGDLSRIYGSDTIDTLKPYFNHCTLYANAILGRGNQIMTKRLVRASAPINVSTANSLTVGTQYAIYNLGTTTNTQWNAAGVVGTPTVGSLFTSSVTSILGSGQVTANNPATAGTTIGISLNSTKPIYQYARTPGTNQVSTDINGDYIYEVGSAAVPIGSFILNKPYQITSLGSTLSVWAAVGWTTANSATGATTPAVGDIFIATATGTAGGGGVANQLVQVIGGITVTVVTLPTVGHTYNDGTPIVNGSETIYPIYTAYDAFPGKDGNNTGIKIWAANDVSLYPNDNDVVLDQESILFNAQLLYRPTNGTASVISNINGVGYTQFSFKPGAYNYKTKSNLNIQQLVTSYSDDGYSTNSSPTYGPLGNFTVYQNNLTTALTQLLASENANNGSVTVPSIWMLDFLTGFDYQGNPFYGYQINTNGLNLNSTNTIYLTGGNDGDLTPATFEAAVLNEINNNYNNPSCNLLNSAKYPFSILYDSGFLSGGYVVNGVNQGDVKVALPKWTGYRKDVSVALSTHSDGGPMLTADQEISVGGSLVASIGQYIESTLWGTAPVRIAIFSQSAYLVDGSYSLPVSLSYDIAVKHANYFGSGAGVVNPTQQYFEYPGNVVTTMKQLSDANLPFTTQTALWNDGVNYVLDYDTRSQYFPGIQTAYGASGIQDSVLVSEPFMIVCTDLEKKAEIVWRQLTNNQTLTEAQFIDKSNKLLISLTSGIYGPGITVTPNTYFTASDVARGYSWVMDINVTGNVPKTVGAVNIIVTRNASDLKITAA